MTVQCFEQSCANTREVSQAGIPHFLRIHWSKFTSSLALKRQNKINRDAFKTIERLDDDMLKDIGLTRGDVIWASTLPLSTNASAELEIIARRRSK